MTDPADLNPSYRAKSNLPSREAVYEMPTRGPRSPLLLGLMILWLLFILTVVTSQFLFH